MLTKLVWFEIELYRYVFQGKKYSEKCYFDDDMRAKTHIFSLSLIFTLWDTKHYRNTSYQQDMKDNLRNVCIPYTGIPLSLFCYHWILAYIFVALIYPCICLVKAWYFHLKDRFHASGSNVPSSLHQFEKNFLDSLLHPSDWFSLWRMNCNLIALHSFVTKSQDYDYEDKWTFLLRGKEMNAPISPFYDMKSIVCKNKLIEGGMGIFFYRNACFGGDWILQEGLENANWLNELLPTNAPLSTMRVITASKCPNDVQTNENSTIEKQYSIYPMTCVLRLGRSGASTDHSSILYNVSMKDGLIESGSVNREWYQLGFQFESLQWWSQFFTWTGCELWNRWLGKQVHQKPSTMVEHSSSPNNDSFFTSRDTRCHWDAPNPVVEGKLVPDLAEALDIVCKYVDQYDLVLLLFFVYGK